MAAGVSRTAVTPPRQRPWISLISSAAVHVLLLVLAVWLTRPKPEDMEEEREVRKEAAEKREVQMVYLSPPPAPPPQPRAVPPPPPPPPPPRPEAPPPRPVAPPPEKAQPVPEPDANAPPDAERSKGAEPKDEENDKVREGQPDAAPPTSPLAANEDPMAAEARRIFGRQKKFTPEGVGPRASRPMEAYLPDHPERCIPKQPPRDSLGQPQYGTVMGKIFRQDDGRPLGGAHLQMLGTPYVTFTDADGSYRFRFDLSLVDNCRTQYVRVTAAGYESRLLVLVVGPNARSEDVLLKRR
jgi:hypothetical protein